MRFFSWMFFVFVVLVIAIVHIAFFPIGFAYQLLKEAFENGTGAFVALRKKTALFLSTFSVYKKEMKFK